MSPFDRQARAALVVACTVLVLSAVGFKAMAIGLQVYLKKEPVELRKKLDTISSTLGDWEMIGDSRKLAAEIVEELGTDDYLDRSYAPDGQPAQGVVALHVTYYTGLIDAVPHVPDRCLVAAGNKIVQVPTNLPLDVDRTGWTPDPEHSNHRTGEPYMIVTAEHPVTRQAIPVRMPIGNFELRTTEFQNPEAPSLRLYSGYFFIANGAVAPTPDHVRLISFRKSEKFAYYCKVQFTVIRPSPFTADEFLEESADLLEALLPDLMQCLPDWSEIEARDPRA